MVGYNKMELQDVGYRGMNWKDLAQDRDRWRALVSRVINCRVPSNFRNFFNILELVSVSR